MMKKVILALILVMFLVWPVQAQEPDDDYVIYLPLVTNMTTCKETWRIVKPDGMTNYCLNPSAEAAGNYAAEAGTTVTLSTTYSHYGLYSYRVQTDADNEGIELTLSTLTNAIHYVTMRVRGDLPSSWVWSLDDSNWRQPTLIESLDANWDLYGVVFSAAQANGSTKLSIHQNGSGTGDFYLDGIQVEDNGYWTMYCDGTQPGCAWNGAADASTSSRSAVSRAGGIIQDLWGDYSFFVEEVIGAGAANQDLHARSYATLPGGELSGAKITERQFTLIGRFVGNSEEDLHQKRQELLKELSLTMYPASQPMRLNFDGAIVQKQIAAYYQGGLEGRLKASYGPFQVESSDQWRRMNYHTERTSIQFLAANPFWYEIGESAETMEVAGTEDANGLIAKLNGVWDVDLITTAATIRAFAEDAQYVYIGGDFTNLNGDPDMDYIARYNKETGIFSALGSGLNGIVNSLAVAPNGDLYIGGQFTAAGGLAAADYFCKWNGTAYEAVGDPDSGTAAITTVFGIAFDSQGDIYVGGWFTDFANVAAADGAAKYDLSAGTWGAVAAGCNGIIYVVVVDSNDNVYFGGGFTNWGDANGDAIVMWDGSALSSLNEGLGVNVLDLRISRDDILYIAGQFSDAGGDTDADYLATWDGTKFSSLGSSVNNDAWSLEIAPDNSIWTSGQFTAAGGITIANRTARWFNNAWSHVPIAYGTSPIAYTLLSSSPDPVITKNYDIWIGGDTNTDVSHAVNTTITNDGSTLAYPQIILYNSGTTTWATLTNIRNETTGEELLFDLGIMGGETITIDLNPVAKSVTSDYRGSLMDKLLPNSDFGQWALIPDDNDISVFVAGTADESGDNNNQLGNWEFVNGIDAANTDNGILYASIVDEGGGDYHVNFYSDSGRSNLVGHTGTYAGVGTEDITEDNSSGLGGRIEIDAVVAADIDIEAYYTICHIIWKDVYQSFD